jgi:hypothetical protein
MSEETKQTVVSASELLSIVSRLNSGMITLDDEGTWKELSKIVSTRFKEIKRPPKIDDPDERMVSKYCSGIINRIHDHPDKVESFKKYIQKVNELMDNKPRIKYVDDDYDMAA